MSTASIAQISQTARRLLLKHIQPSRLVGSFHNENHDHNRALQHMRQTFTFLTLACRQQNGTPTRLLVLRARMLEMCDVLEEHATLVDDFFRDKQEDNLSASYLMSILRACFNELL